MLGTGLGVGVGGDIFSFYTVEELDIWVLDVDRISVTNSICSS